MPPKYELRICIVSQKSIQVLHSEYSHDRQKELSYFNVLIFPNQIEIEYKETMSYSRENPEVSASGEDRVNAMRGYKASVFSSYFHETLTNL